jgi:hypothetical protein
VALDVRALKFGLSPRHIGQDERHIRVLMERFGDLPPILVFGATLEVIDGVHRTLAARRLGHATICARLYSGTREEALVEAVRANISHGKPLSMDERRSAARRLLIANPDWSDRLIAGWCGISPRTVGVERSRSSHRVAHVGSRVGRDGRVRPSDPAATRLRIVELLKSSPGASLRLIAAEAHTSQATVLDVKRRIARGEAPLPTRQLAPRPSATSADLRADLADDRALRRSDECSTLVRWFEEHSMSEMEVVDLDVDCVPISRTYLLADEARRQSTLWSRIATALEQRGGASRSGSH